MVKPVAITYARPNMARQRILHRVSSIAAAEAWIAKRMKQDPAGVAAGFYGVDAPEHLLG